MPRLLFMRCNKNKYNHLYFGKAKYLYMPPVWMIHGFGLFAARVSCLYYCVTEKKKEERTKIANLYQNKTCL